MAGQHNLRRRRIRADLAALGPAARVVERLEVAGVAQGGGPQADAEAGLVHHREHLLQARVLLAHEVAHRARLAAGGVQALTQAGGGVDRAAEPHLVVEAGDDDVVALTQRAVVVDQELRNHEQADPPSAGRGPGDLRQHQMDDVLAHLVLAAGDPHLLAEQSVRAVGLRLGARGDVREVGAGLRLGQAHGAGEAAFDHGPDVALDLFLGAVREQQVGVARGEQRVAGGADVGGIEPGHARQVRGVRQLHAAHVGVHGGSHEVRLGEPAQRLADLGDELHVLTDQLRLVQVGGPVVGGEVLRGELGGQVHDRVDRLPGVVGVPLAFGQLGYPKPVVEEEVEVGAGQQGRGAHALQTTWGVRGRRRIRGRSRAPAQSGTPRSSTTVRITSVERRFPTPGSPARCSS